MDRKILLGIGIGIIIGVAFTFFNSYTGSKREGQIEESARGIGMHYDTECKVIFKGDEKK